MRGRAIPALLFLGLFPLFLFGCAERENPADVTIQAHSEAWNQAGSEDFHGSRVAENTAESCTTCHGAQLMGQGRAQSCSDCHAGGRSGHPASSEWIPPSGNAFHGTETATTGAAPCARCHGEEFRGGWAEVSCFTCHDGPSGHPEGWLIPLSENWHANAVADSGVEPCATCHGEDFRGGWAEVSCFTCHDGPSGHPEGWLIPLADEWHANAVAETGPQRCQSCHGEDYRGGTSGVSCYRCHDGPSGHPEGWLSSSSDDYHAAEWGGDDEACSDCHGNDLMGGTSGVSCGDCHSWPLFR